jgi:hypothetical protein
MWSFALALVPLTIAVVRELVIMAKSSAGTDPLESPGQGARPEPAYNKHL